MVVIKFGGSSVRDACGIKRCAEVALSHEDVRVVVISATYNTTNELEKASVLAFAKSEDVFFDLVKTIHTRHLQMATELGILSALEDRFDELFLEMRSHFSELNTEALLSVGERYSSLLVFEYLRLVSSLRVSFLDARQVIKTKSVEGENKVVFSVVKENCRSLLVPNELFITQGFIASCNESARTTLLGREGSDYTATIFADAVNAKKVFIYSDVEGISNINPTISSRHSTLLHLNYKMATEMAKAGAKVLFHRTLEPLIERKIPLIVASTFNPDGKFTLIDDENIQENFMTFTLEERCDQSYWLHLMSSRPKTVTNFQDSEKVRFLIQSENDRLFLLKENVNHLVEHFHDYLNEIDSRK